VPADILVEWIEYFKEKERRELLLMVEALSTVLAKIFPKEEE
jgi:hypothetical protein